MRQQMIPFGGTLDFIFLASGVITVMGRELGIDDYRYLVIVQTGTTEEVVRLLAFYSLLFFPIAIFLCIVI